MRSRHLASIFLCLSLAIPAFAQSADSNNLEIYNGCGMEGDARSSGVQALNRLKNRYAAPQQIDPAITLAAMLAPGRDTGRWKVKQGAEIIGYVFDVKVGGVESTNCHAFTNGRRLSASPVQSGRLIRTGMLPEEMRSTHD
jgi:hypothetical protein